MYCDACSSEFAQIVRHRVRESRRYKKKHWKPTESLFSQVAMDLTSKTSGGSERLELSNPSSEVWASGVLRSSSKLDPIFKSELFQVRQRINEFSRQPGSQF